MSDLYSDLNAPEIYVDGIAGAAFGAGVARVSCFRTYDVVPSDVDGIEDSVEKREVTLSLVMPLPSLIQFAAGVVASVAANKEMLAAPNTLLLESVEQSLEAIRKAMPQRH
jgi:hypothetical protein